MKSTREKFIPEPMTCQCGKVALYRVFRIGYCRDHYDAAVKDQAEVLRKQKVFAIARRLKGNQ